MVRPSKGNVYIVERRLANVINSVFVVVSFRAQEAKDESSFRFTGQGYAELAQIPRYDSRQYSVTLSFKSLDENALLFLAINDTIVSL